MSLSARQRTCAVCARELPSDSPFEIRTLVDGVTRPIATHPECDPFKRPKGATHES